MFAANPILSAWTISETGETRGFQGNPRKKIGQQESAIEEDDPIQSRIPCPNRFTVLDSTVYDYPLGTIPDNLI